MNNFLDGTSCANEQGSDRGNVLISREEQVPVREQNEEVESEYLE